SGGGGTSSARSPRRTRRSRRPLPLAPEARRKSFARSHVSRHAHLAVIPMRLPLRTCMIVTMTLKEKLETDLSAAIKARDEVRARTLRMALTAVKNEE